MRTLLWAGLTFPVFVHAAAPVVETAPVVEEPTHSPEALKRLSLDSLVNLEITSASRRPENIALTPSAIDVLTNDDIRRSGATNIPDALRLANGLHVSQISGSSWAISSRGFSTNLSNKMLVLMDGRSLYTPLFSGVFWDVQHTFLPDIEQVEVIRGPGATLWGANAVNGVINIRTKSAKDTQGFMLQGGGGDEERLFGGVRYGGKIGNTAFRIYGTHLNRDSLTLESGGDGGDHIALTKAGFRLDSDLSPDDLLTFQGDSYTGRFGQLGLPDSDVDGYNVLARWTRQLDQGRSFMVQAYVDFTHRLVPGSAEEDRTTYDIETQHRFFLGDGHDIIWGLNYRASDDRVNNLGPALAFMPDSALLQLGGGYIQDEMQLVPKKLILAIGSKFEYNSFSGFEIQPSGRLAWHITDHQTIWGAVSRAVRTPSRFDQDLFIPNPAFGPMLLFSNREFESEELIAYELGYRARPLETLSIDLALFFHDYDKLRSIDATGVGAGMAGGPFLISNTLEGESYGAELGVKWQPVDWARLQLGYTILETNFRRKGGSRDITDGSVEGNDPNNRMFARCSIDLARNVELDVIMRYTDRLPNPYTPDFLTLDARLGWQATDNLEFAIIGRNLLDEQHTELRSGAGTREIGRSVFGTVTLRF